MTLPGILGAAVLLVGFGVAAALLMPHDGSSAKMMSRMAMVMAAMAAEPNCARMRVSAM